MANPIFRNSSTFNRPPAAPQAQNQWNQQQGQWAQPQQGQAPQGQQPFNQQGQWNQPQGYQQAPPTGGVMTLDDVIVKTATTMLVLFATAALTFMFLPEGLMFPALIGSGIVGFVTVLLVARRHTIPVGGVMFYAAIEGVFVGAISKVFEGWYDGIVPAAVLATFVAAGATLAAYKFFNIRVTPKFRKMVSIGTVAMLGVFIVNFALAMFGIDTGMRDIGSDAGLLSIAISVLAVGLAVFNLIVDFDFVERGIASRAPASESWRAAFGITITMVWLYIEILRILSYFRN